MFSWICPTCGRDVPPSKTECPFCAENQKHLAAMQQPPAPPPPIMASQPEQAPPVEQPVPPAYQPPYQQQAPPQQPQYQQPGQWQGHQYPPQQQLSQQPSSQYAPQQPQYAPPQQPYPPQYAPAPGQHSHQQPWPPPQKKPIPTAVLMAGFALAILAVGSAVYFGSQKLGKTNPQEKAGLENPANPSKAKVSNPLQKYVEVVGIRLLGDSKKKPVAKFVVVNHSSTEIDGLAATVTLWASTARSEEDSVASFNFQLPRIGAGESRELTQPVKTKLKLYELPDWQNANADVQITAP